MPVAKVTNLLADLQKRFGEDKVMMASAIPVGSPISTGSLALDFATNYGGFPSNRAVEICGREGVGKTSVALTAMLNALEKYPDRAALFLDVEHKVTPEWLRQIVGAELLDNRVIYIQPTSIENATNIYRQALESGQICCAILDSIGGSPTVRRNDDAEVGHYGGNAMGVGEFARSAATLSAAHHCLTIGINQTREDMSGYHMLNRPGGNAWKHAIVMCVELVKGRDTVTIKMPGEEKPVPVGYTVFAKIRKNQVGAPGRTAKYWFFNIPTDEHEFGIDQLDEISRLAVMTVVVKQTGGWYHHPALPEDSKGEHKVNGIANFQRLVKADDSLRATIVSEVLASLKEHGGDVAPISDPEAPVDVESES